MYVIDHVAELRFVYRLIYVINRIYTQQLIHERSVKCEEVLQRIVKRRSDSNFQESRHFPLQSKVDVVWVDKN